MAQDTTWTGAVLTESDINTYLMGEGGAWTNYTPTLLQPGAITKTVNYARYARFGRTIIGGFYLSVTGTGTAANVVNVALPVTAVGTNDLTFVGSGKIYDASSGFEYVSFCVLNSTTALKYQIANTAGAIQQFLGATGFTAALASGDVVVAQFQYEAAS
jgi:hypothetical protein